MRATRYSRWTCFDWDDLSLSDLMNSLSDYLLESGFHEQLRAQWRERFGNEDAENRSPDEVLESIRAAIRQALRDSGLLSDEQHKQLFDKDGNANSEELGRLVEELLARLINEGYLSLQSEGGDVEWYIESDEDGRPKRVRFVPRDSKGEAGPYEKPQLKIEVAQKGVDFLGYKALKQLLSSIGQSTLGRHDTNQLTTGVELVGSSKQYEFGDTMNLDISQTLLSAIARKSSMGPSSEAKDKNSSSELLLDVDYQDLHVLQSEYQSSCATVLMLDCSHSMILYGEDRFSPAKRVALALSHLIRTQYPGDSLNLVLFHDGAEEVPLSKLASIMVGPFHTNTAEGLKLSRRVLQRQRKEMRQIIMITDGKPSALFLNEETAGKQAAREDGSRRLYKNSNGLDPLIISQTLKEAAECRRAGILINTFMLTDDFYLVEFVKQLTEIASGKAYFTSSLELGDYVMMDFMKRKVQKVR